MHVLHPTFLPPAPVHTTACLHRAAFSNVCHRVHHASRTAVRPVRRRTLCVAQEELTNSPPSSSQQPPSSHSDVPTTPVGGDRKEKARQARLEAERLEIMAAKARLEFERAELKAERKRLELDKIRNVREIEKSKADPLPSGPNSTSPVDNPYNTTDQVRQPAKATVKVGSSPPKEVTAGSLTDLLSAEFPRVSEADISIIKDKICGMDTFFVTEVDRSPFDERVVFRGNMRMDAKVLLEEVEARAEKEGVGKRVRLFLLIDPKESPNDADGLRRPVLVALPASAMPNQSNAFSFIFSIVVGLAAFATSFSYGIGIFGFTPEVITKIVQGDTAEALVTLPVSVGGMIVAILHDIGHRVMGKLRNVKLGLPFFIPSLQIGHFGIITPLESYMRLRSDLFDVAVAGPIAGSVSSLVALIVGLVVTAGGQTAEWFPQVPSALFHGSLLIGALADTILPAALREQATMAVHPLTIIGYTGLLVNALNLMPIGRLDGGRIMQALYGRVIAGRATAVTLLVQAVGSVISNSPLLLFWGLVCVFLQRESDIPCLNEVLEPDNTRAVIGLSMLILMLLVLIPFPDQVSDIIGNVGNV